MGWKKETFRKRKHDSDNKKASKWLQTANSPGNGNLVGREGVVGEKKMRVLNHSD